MTVENYYLVEVDYYYLYLRVEGFVADCFDNLYL
jgi:hypothetical protein